MRTTVTLDPDVDQIITQWMRENNQTFDRAINDVIRSYATSGAEREPFRTETASMGSAQVNLDRALQVVGEAEDGELIRRRRTDT